MLSALHAVYVKNEVPLPLQHLVVLWFCKRTVLFSTVQILKRKETVTKGFVGFTAVFQTGGMMFLNLKSKCKQKNEMEMHYIRVSCFPCKNRPSVLQLCLTIKSCVSSGSCYIDFHYSGDQWLAFLASLVECVTG